jgi:predicted phosphatase
MLNIKKPRWTHHELTFLHTNWENMTDKELSDVLGRSVKSVSRKREHHKLMKRVGKEPTQFESND